MYVCSRQGSPCKRLQGTAFMNPTHTGTVSAQWPALSGFTHTHAHTHTHTTLTTHTHTTHTHIHTRTHTTPHLHTRVHTFLSISLCDSVMLPMSTKLFSHFPPDVLTEHRRSGSPRSPFHNLPIMVSHLLTLVACLHCRIATRSIPPSRITRSICCSRMFIARSLIIF